MNRRPEMDAALLFEKRFVESGFLRSMEHINGVPEASIRGFSAFQTAIDQKDNRLPMSGRRLRD
tara:strand:+ start:2190 stop:2381 length:192 start_codon:yes stop_codon:yes gene_type:complete